MESPVTESSADLSTDKTGSPLEKARRVTPAPEEQADWGGKSEEGAEELQAYDFRQQPLLGEVERRQLHAEHTSFLRALTIRLTMYLRSDWEFQLDSMNVLSFRQVVAEMPAESHLTLFKLEERPGICLWEVAPPLALSFTDSLTGGSGLSPETPPPLSDVEVALLDHLAEMILEEWCQTWVPDLQWQAALLGHETEGRYLRTSSPETAVLVVNIRVRLPRAEGTMRLAFPLNTLEPLIQCLRSASQPQTGPAFDVAPSAPPWNPALEDISISVTAELPGLQVSARELHQLKVGEEIGLPAAFTDQVRLYVGGMTRFAGRLGVKGDHWAVEVNQIIKR